MKQSGAAECRRTRVFKSKPFEFAMLPKKGDDKDENGECLHVRWCHHVSARPGDFLLQTG
jgi:hypothetical protein